jgi:hypothetical protein
MYGNSFIVVLVGGLVMGLVSYWRQRRRAEIGIRAARALRSRPVIYRVPLSDDTDLLARLPRLGEHEAMLVSNGFFPLGDVVMQSGAARIGIMRAFVDEGRTICAYLIIPSGSPSRVVLLLESYSPSGEFSTFRRPHADLAQPPFSHQQIVEADLSYAQTAVQHRAFLASKNVEDILVRIGSLDVLLNELHRGETLIREWRAAQQPDALLEADLRALFGPRYERHGKRWKRRLTRPLPKATMKR